MSLWTGSTTGYDFDQISLACRGGFITINNAIYGNSDRTSVVQALCNNNPNCTITVAPNENGGNLGPGDPAPGVRKTATINWACFPIGVVGIGGASSPVSQKAPVSMIPMGPTGPQGNTLSAGSTLTSNRNNTLAPGAALTSPNGQWVIINQLADGNVIGISSNGVIAGSFWNTGTTGNPGSNLVLQANGDLQVVGKNGVLLHSEGVGNMGIAPYTAAINNNGTFTITDSTGKVIWQRPPSSNLAEVSTSSWKWWLIVILIIIALVLIYLQFWRR